LATLSPSVIGFAHILVVLAASAASVGPPARAEPPANTAPVVSLHNPASQNCVDKGGRLTLEKNRKSGQFEVCTFPGNQQCEERLHDQALAFVRARLKSWPRPRADRCTNRVVLTD